MAEFSAGVLMANLSCLVILSLLFCWSSFGVSKSSLMLSRYVRRVLPTGGFMFVIGLNFLNFLKDSLWSLMLSGMIGVSAVLDLVTLVIVIPF